MTKLGLTHLLSWPQPLKGVISGKFLNIAVFGINLKVCMITQWRKWVLLTSSPNHVSFWGQHDLDATS